MNIEIPDALADALIAKAQAEGLSASAYAFQILERNLIPAASAQPKKSAYGLLAPYGPGPTVEQIDENRREMFHASPPRLTKI